MVFTAIILVYSTCKWCCLDATLKKELSLFDRLLLRVLCPTQASFSVCSGFLKGKRCLYANTKSKVPGDQVDCPEIYVDSHCFSVVIFNSWFALNSRLTCIWLLYSKKRRLSLDKYRCKFRSVKSFYLMIGIYS